MNSDQAGKTAEEIRLEFWCLINDFADSKGQPISHSIAIDKVNEFISAQFKQVEESDKDREIERLKELLHGVYVSAKRRIAYDLEFDEAKTNLWTQELWDKFVKEKNIDI